MAKYKDPYLKQIVDDLNILNVDTIPVPLTVDQCVLTDPVEDLTGGGITNTRATLTIPEADVNYPAGSMTVRYRRLELEELRGESPTTLTFLGVAGQTKTLAQVLATFSSGIATYILPELEDNGPFNLTRDSQQITLQPRADSMVLTPTTLTLNVATSAMDLADFTQTENMLIFGMNPTPYPAYGSSVENFILGRITTLNQQTAPLLIDDVELEVVPPPAYEANQFRLRVTVTNPESYYKGTNVFHYFRSTISGMLGDSYTTVFRPFTEGQTMRQVINSLLQTANLYCDVNDIVETPVKPVRQVDFRDSSNIFDYSEIVSNSDSLWLSPTDINGGPRLKLVSTDLYPFESIIKFSVLTAGQKTILRTTNTGTMPVTIELLEKPAEFVPATLDVNASFLTTQSLPVGEYKIRITRPDSYHTPLRHRASPSTLGNDIQITEIFKVKAHDLTEMFVNCTALTVIHPGAFDESTYTHNAIRLFAECTSLASLPVNIFNSLTRCFFWTGCFARTTSLLSVPDTLFAFIRGVTPSLEGMFPNSAVKVIPTNFLKDARYVNLSYLFSGCGGIETISPGFIAAMNLARPTKVTGMFLNCASLNNLPADLFVGTVPPVTPSPILEDITTDWDLQDTFANCASLTSLPANLLRPLIDSGREKLALRTTFKGCTALTAIPQGFLDGAVAPLGGSYRAMLQGTWEGCTALTSIRGDIFQNVQLGTIGLGLNGFPDTGGAFKDSGLTSLPLGLFTNNSQCEAMPYLFSGTQITEIPADLLVGANSLKDATSMFTKCSQLTTVPAGLFAPATTVDNINSLFWDCTALTSVPGSLLWSLPLLSKATYAFWRTGLTALPPEFFLYSQALTTVEGIFYDTALAGPLDDVFTNHPVLTDVHLAFGLTDITTVGANVFSGAPAITTVAGAFQACRLLTTVHPDLLKNNVALTNVSNLFSSTDLLTSLPAAIFAFNPELTDVSGLISGSFTTGSGMQSLPAGLFANNKKITTLAGFARYARALTAIPTGLFDGLDKVTNATDVFANCSGLAAIPDFVFKDLVLCTTYSGAFQGTTELGSIGNNLFPLTTVAVSLADIFNTTGATVVPDGIFFNLKNITTLSKAFNNNPQLTTVGRLVQNTTSTRIYLDTIFGADGNMPAPANFPDVTLADNLIDSTIALNLTCQFFGGPFSRRTLLTKDITNLFGANCKITLTTNSKAWFNTTQVTGAGVPFIAKHQIAATTGTPALFTGVTTLSDYASLPAWAKA